MNLVSEKEFLDLPLVSVAEIVRCRGPKVSVFPFDGTRRWFHLECNPQYDDYQQAALRQSIRILKMLFEHGIETVISPIFSDDLLDRGDRYIVQALEGMALLANDEEILSFYKEHEVHVLFYGDYKKRLPSTAQGAAVVKSFDDLTISTSSNTEHRLCFGVFGNDAAESVAQFSISWNETHGKPPTRREIIEGYYGEYVDKADMFIGFGRFSTFDFPLLSSGKTSLYLAAMISLTSNKHRRRRAAQVEKGLLALKNLTSGAFEGPQLDIKDATVGFELIAPTLMAEAARLGLAICHEESILGELVGVREQKLRKLGGSKINKHITAAFSVELAGQDGVGMLDVDNLQETNGSVKYSPSASAYFALHVKPGDKRALAYISSIIQAGDGGAPAFYQAEIFEIVWSLWNLSRTDIDLSDPEIVRTYLPYLDHVEQHWVRGRGVGWTGNSTLEDCDTTSVAYDVLSKFGRSPDIGAVLQFEDADWFRTYFHEVGPSISTNVHVLGALKQAGYDKCHPRVRKVLEFIRSSKEPGRFCWRDKWHRSAYYTTAHLICAASNYDDALCSDAIGWILNTQRPDGSWGFFDGQATAEETAYCIQALAHWQRHSGTSLSAQISRAGGWLSQHCEPPYAPLWIAKTLYCSATVVKAAILSALRLVDESNQ